MFKENNALLCVETCGLAKEEALRGDAGVVLKDGRDGGVDEERQCRASTTSWHGPW